MNRFRLTVSYRDRVRRFPFPESARRLGSSADSDWVVPFPGVSRQHAVVHPHGTAVRIVDAGSKNGLIAFGERQRELVLEPGQEVLIGHASAVLEPTESEEAEVALALSSDESTESTELKTDPRSDDGLGSAHSALRLIRQLETEEANELSRDELLQRTRAVLGAGSLFELRLDEEGRPRISSCIGGLPTEDTLELIALHREHLEADEHEAVLLDNEPPATALLAVPSPDSTLVCLFSGPPSSIETWQGEFLLYLASRTASSDDASADHRAGNGPESKGELPELKPPPEMIVGTSPAMSGLIRHLRVAAGSDLNVLLLGETGTGKELIARMIHASGTHSEGPFVPINCAAIPAELLEAELFGIAGRVATGVDARPGLFLQAQGGVIFLDEVSETSDRLQAKLLRVLQEREVLAVGGTKAKQINVRIIASSNRDLEREVLEGRFRDDLYFRLRGLQFHVPPLRDRREDVPQLVLHFANRAARKYGRRISGVSRRALDLLTQYAWPGNVRELEHEVERAVLLCEGCRVLRTDHFSAISRRRASSGPRWESSAPSSAEPPGTEDDALDRIESDHDRSLQEQLDEVERRAILRALARSDGNKTRAAAALGITRNGLALKIKRLGIEPEAGPPDDGNSP